MSYVIDDPAMDDALSGGVDTGDQTGGLGGPAVDTSGPSTAASVDQTQTDDGTGNKNAYGGGLPNPGGNGYDRALTNPDNLTTPQGIGPPGMPDQPQINNQPGLFAAEPSQQAAAQGVPGFSMTGAGGLPNPGGGGGGESPNYGVPQGNQLMAAGPGWAIDSTGRFSSTNTPDYVRQNQGWQGGYIGPGTVVQAEPHMQGASNPIQQGKYTSDNANYSTFGGGLPNPGGGFGGNFAPTSAAQIAGTNFSDYGPQRMQGGLYGSFEPGGIPIGAGVNMARQGGDSSQQARFNASVGAAIPGGGGVNAPPLAYVGGASGAPAFGQGISGVMSPDGTFAGRAPGGSPIGAAAIAGQPGTNPTGSPDQWAQHFQNTFGFYDPRFNSKENFLANAQQGDAVIRGAALPGGKGPDQLATMAQVDPDARRILDAINSAPGFYGSQNAAAWDTAHAGQIQNRMATEFANNPAARQNLAGQVYSPPNNPVDNAHALMTDQMRTSLIDTLTKMGATNFQPTFDRYGNMTVGYTAANGSPQTLTKDGRAFALTDYADALDRLKGMAGTPAAGGGGYSPRGNSRGFGGGGGNGGGNAGANLANAVTGIGGNPAADQQANTRIRDFFPNGGVSRATASAVGYEPGIEPGGNPPY